MMNDVGRLTGSRERSQSPLSPPVGFDPGREAATLSPTQRSVILGFCARINSPYGYYASDLGASGAACAALERKGLLQGGLFAGDRSRAYRWTKKGEAVAAAIAMEAATAGETVGLDPKDDSAGPQDIAQ